MALIRSASLVLLLALAGCTTVAPKAPPPPPYAAATVQAQTLAAGHAALTGPARRDNAEAILRLLADLDDATLTRDAARLSANDPLYPFVARVLQQRGLPLPHPLSQSGFRFGAADRPPAASDGWRPPLRVAVLLPLTGPQAPAAAAVRDGYLAGYYSSNRPRPQVRFYDTTGGVRAALARAAADGNDAAVGPLIREDVDAVFTDTPPLPLLALNRGEHMPPEGSAAFSLSPEDEGVSLAEALLEGHYRHVLLIVGDDDAQRRTAATAQARLQQRNVQVSRLAYAPAMTDALTSAAQQAHPDAVLLLLKGAQARVVVPQLALANLAGLPRYAGAQITQGTGNPTQDAALDGTLFPTEPWLVQRIPGLPTQREAAARVDTAQGPAARLFAFGLDAWQLTGMLESLARQPQATLTGATGRLSLDAFGMVVRRPGWSRFSGGVPVPVTNATP